MKKWLLWIILLPVNFTSYSQIKIDSMMYSLSYDDNCFAYEYTFVVPRFKGEHKLVKTINDSVASILKPLSDFDLVQTFKEVSDGGECEIEIYGGPESTSLSFQIYSNTDSLLSFAIVQSIGAGNGGHGGESHSYHFNYDLIHNKELKLDDLFDPANEEKMVNKVKKQWEQEYDVDWETNGPYIRQLGFNIAGNYFVVSYSVYMGHSITNIYTFQIPLKEIKPLLRKNYVWIAGKTKN